MARKKYIMPANEIQALVSGFMQFGPEDLYNKMKAKALMIMDKSYVLDEEFLDRAEIFLKKAREEPDNSDDSPSLKDIYYTLSFMLKRLGNEIHRKYKKENTNEERFLRVMTNDKVPKLMVK